MMNPTKKEIKRNSLRPHNKTRNAGFVLIDEPITKRLKYVPFLKRYSTKIYFRVKTGFNKSWQIPKKYLAEVDWVPVVRDSSIWIVEAAIEGFIANFATHFLFGVRFNLPIMLAHGFLIKQAMGIYWQLKKDGPSPKIP